MLLWLISTALDQVSVIPKDQYNTADIAFACKINGTCFFNIPRIGKE
jgi:hypothetical protein